MRGSTGPVRSISSTTDRSACWLACEAPPVAQTAKGERTSNSAANARRVTIECTAGAKAPPGHLPSRRYGLGGGLRSMAEHGGTAGDRWQGRPVQAAVLRLFVVGVPVAAAIAISLLFS